jgi:hypothetical protein
MHLNQSSGTLWNKPVLTQNLLRASRETYRSDWQHICMWLAPVNPGDGPITHLVTVIGSAAGTGHGPAAEELTLGDASLDALDEEPAKLDAMKGRASAPSSHQVLRIGEVIARCSDAIGSRRRAGRRWV